MRRLCFRSPCAHTKAERAFAVVVRTGDTPNDIVSRFMESSDGIVWPEVGRTLLRKLGVYAQRLRSSGEVSEPVGMLQPADLGLWIEEGEHAE